MCRMCLVEIETPRGKMLVPSCTTQISDEMIVDTESAVSYTHLRAHETR